MKNDNRPYIGSFVLETLTTGMYGESRNALREYVQNAFDAISSAVNVSLLAPNEGRIHVLLPDNNTIVISDNGIGLSEVAAAGTLISIGASKKDRTRDAGFRGIGRLAGIAFCNLLTFATKTAGEDSETVVTFNCSRLRKEMGSEAGSQELADLLQENVKVKVNKVGKVREHYMNVTLQGLSLAPPQFKDIDSVRDYLVETSPLAFDPEWEAGAEIESEATSLGKSIDYTNLYIGRTTNNSTQLYKAYADSYAVKNDSVSIKEIQYPRGDTWWGWVGMPDKPAMIEDQLVHGLRIRVKNIQIDGVHIFDELFARVKPSYGRFNKYYVGEVHVNPGVLVPNARRDGFEDNEAWDKVKKDLMTVLCKPLATRAYKLSRDRQKSFEAIKRKVDRLEKQAKAPTAQLTDVKKRALLKSANDIRKLIAEALDDADSETKLKLRPFILSIDSIRKQITPVDERSTESQLRAEIKKEVIAKVLSIIERYLEPQLFNQVKKELITKT